MIVNLNVVLCTCAHDLKKNCNCKILTKLWMHLKVLIDNNFLN